MINDVQAPDPAAAAVTASLTAKAELLACPDAHVSPTLISLPIHLIRASLYMIPLALIDMVILRRHPRLRDSRTRWFALHALANAVIVVASMPDLVHCVLAPMCSMVGPIVWTPSYITFAIHLYHFLAFTNLRREDLVHHVLFWGVFSFFDFTVQIGPVVNALLFFMCGLPGGITYALLVLVKTGHLPSLTEKRISSHLNTYVRNPGLIFVATVGLVCAMHEMSRVPFAVVMFCAVLAAINGIYYGQMAQANYTEKRVLARCRPISSCVDDNDLLTDEGLGSSHDEEGSHDEGNAADERAVRREAVRHAKSKRVAHAVAHRHASTSSSTSVSASASALDFVADADGGEYVDI